MLCDLVSSRKPGKIKELIFLAACNHDLFRSRNGPAVWPAKKSSHWPTRNQEFLPRLQRARSSFSRPDEAAVLDLPADPLLDIRFHPANCPVT